MRGTAARGYGRNHQAERRRIERLLTAGLTLRCVCSRPDCPYHAGQCSTPISRGTPWDLGHDDYDRTRYTGPECVPCNRSAGARASNGQKPMPSTRRPAAADRW